VIAHVKEALKLINIGGAELDSDRNPQDLLRDIEEVKGDPKDIDF
jgi:hypothetical protein